MTDTSQSVHQIKPFPGDAEMILHTGINELII